MFTRSRLGRALVLAALAVVAACGDDGASTSPSAPTSTTLPPLTEVAPSEVVAAMAADGVTITAGTDTQAFCADVEALKEAVAADLGDDGAATVEAFVTLTERTALLTPPTELVPDFTTLVEVYVEIASRINGFEGSLAQADAQLVAEGEESVFNPLEDVAPVLSEIDTAVEAACGTTFS